MKILKSKPQGLVPLSHQQMRHLTTSQVYYYRDPEGLDTEDRREGRYWYASPEDVLDDEGSSENMVNLATFVRSKGLEIVVDVGDAVDETTKDLVPLTLGQANVMPEAQVKRIFLGPNQRRAFATPEDVLDNPASTRRMRMLAERIQQGRGMPARLSSGEESVPRNSLRDKTGTNVSKWKRQRGEFINKKAAAIATSYLSILRDGTTPIKLHEWVQQESSVIIEGIEALRPDHWIHTDKAKEDALGEVKRRAKDLILTRVNADLMLALALCKCRLDPEDLGWQQDPQTVLPRLI